MDNQDQEGISLKELIVIIIEWFKYLTVNWLIIFLVGVLGGLVGLGYAYTKKPIYTAELTFALEEKGGGASGINNLASSFGLSLGGSEGGAFAGDNIIELMKSRKLIEMSLLTKVNSNNQTDLLINKFIKTNKLNENWEKQIELRGLKFDNNSREHFSRAQDSILGQVYQLLVKNNLSVSKIDKKLSIISVKTNSRNEEFAKLFCETLVKNVTDFYIETKVGKAKVNIINLENRVDSVRRELNQAMYGRAAFADRNLGLIKQSAAVPKLQQEMKVQMLSTMYGELVKNLEFSKLALMREEPLIQIIDTPIYPLKKEKLGKIKGVLLGGILSGFIICLILIGRKLLKNAII